MSDYKIKGIKISNPNNVDVTLNYGLTSSLGTKTTIGANSNTSIDIECDYADTPVLVYFQLTADNWKDSQIVSKSFSYNPLNDIQVSISGGYDSSTGMYTDTVTLTNLSPIDLDIDGDVSSADTFFGQAGNSSNVVATGGTISIVSGGSAVYVIVSSSDGNGSYDFEIRDRSETYDAVEYKS